MDCNLNDPTSVVYNSVKELLDLASAGNFPKTQAQIANFTVKMIQNTQDFETGLKMVWAYISWAYLSGI